MNINEATINLYGANWLELKGQLGALSRDQYTNPFLLAFDEEELKSCDMRVMIFGQETKGWGEESGIIDSAEEVVSMYHHFFCQKNFYAGYRKSAFWKAFRYFEKQIKGIYPDKKICFSWNNINKIGKSGGKTGVSSDVRKIEYESFSVISYEVEIFKPHIVIFLTGPDRDCDIKHQFKDAEFTAISPDIKTRALAKVKSKLLPDQTIRMYHPSFFGGFYKVRKYAVEELTKLSGTTSAN
jgi:hypothetical protein